MTREEKEQTGKYVLQMARLLEDGCYQQEMLLKVVHIIDEALEHDPCDDVAAFKEDALDAISRVGLFKSDTKEVQTVAECLRAVEALSPVMSLQKEHKRNIEEDKVNGDKEGE